MGFFSKRKSNNKFFRAIFATPPEKGKTTTGINLSHSEKLGPVGVIGIEGGTHFYEGKLNSANGSDIIEINDLVDAISIIKELSNTRPFPFKTVFVDGWASLYKRFQNLYDETKGQKNIGAIKEEEDLYNESRKTMNDWGQLKSPFSRLISEIVFLPANVIFSSWMSHEQKAGGVPDVNKPLVKLDTFIHHMCDIVAVFDEFKVKRIIKDRSGTLKLGDKLGIKIFEDVWDKINTLEEIPDAPTTSKIYDSSEKPQSEDENLCESCGTGVNKNILKITAKSGQRLCLNCFKKSKQ